MRRFHTDKKREIATTVKNISDQYSKVIQLFKIALEKMPTDNYKVRSRADKTPVGQHGRQYKASTFDEVTIAIEFSSRDIISQLQK